MPLLLYLSLAYLLLINLVTFIYYGADKSIARRNGNKHKKVHQRISEATLIWLAVVGGSAGAVFGMAIFHHKTQHKKFIILVPLILLVHMVLIAFFLYI